jgi:protein O-mannosyl-transferase
VPLIFDDAAAITDNPSIRHLWPILPLLTPPAECTVAGRPLANITFALNYAFGQTSVWGYHAVNLVLHILAALTLFGVIRRSMSAPFGKPTPYEFQAPLLTPHITIVAAIGSGLWALHPVLTTSVTYISQRTEVMAGLFCLLTLYGFIRGIESSSAVWLALSILACLGGMLCKEGMVMTPALVYFYDATFVSGSFWRAARRWRYYSLLALTWVPLVFLMSGLAHRAVGFGLGVPWWRYSLTECEAVMTYMSLTFWPHPLIFDYGDMFMKGGALACLLVIFIAIALSGATSLYFRRPRLGFCAVAFFVMLAPTSSIVPIATQPIAENRLYLPSAALITLVIVSVHCAIGKRLLALAILTGSALLLSTLCRNRVYGSRLSLWADTAMKRPANARAIENLGEALYEVGQPAAARSKFQEALRLNPNYVEAHNNLGTTLHRIGDRAGAIHHFKESIRLRPTYAIAHNNLGNALTEAGQLDDARAHLKEALRLYTDNERLKPDIAETHNNMGNVLLYQGNFTEALEHYEHAVKFRPNFPEAQMNLGVALRQTGKTDRALKQFDKALKQKPGFPEAQFNLAVTLHQLGRLAEARASYEGALRRAPHMYQAHRNLAEVLAEEGDLRSAVAHLDQAVRLQPDDVLSRQNLEILRRRLGIGAADRN